MPICQDKPGYCYVYEVCEKKFLGICTKKGWREEFIDLTLPETRKELIDMGWELRRDP